VSYLELIGFAKHLWDNLPEIEKQKYSDKKEESKEY
jgi:hypothetical protein